MASNTDIQTEPKLQSCIKCISRAYFPIMNMQSLPTITVPSDNLKLIISLPVRKQQAYHVGLLLLSVVILFSPTYHVLLWPSRVTPVLGAQHPPSPASPVSVENYSGGYFSSPW
jgi:hypothetical protein